MRHPAAYRSTPALLIFSTRSRLLPATTPTSAHTITLLCKLIRGILRRCDLLSDAVQPLINRCFFLHWTILLCHFLLSQATSKSQYNPVWNFTCNISSTIGKQSKLYSVPTVVSRRYRCYPIQIQTTLALSVVLCPHDPSNHVHDIRSHGTCKEATVLLNHAGDRFRD